MTDDVKAAAKQAERLNRARLLVSRGHFKDNADAPGSSFDTGVEAGLGTEGKSRSSCTRATSAFGRGRDGSRGRGRTVIIGFGRSHDARGHVQPRAPRVFAAPTKALAHSCDEASPGRSKGVSRKIWQPKTARALDIGSSVQQGALPEEPDAPVMALPGDDDVERPTLPIHTICAYDTLGELGKGQFGVVSQAVRRKSGCVREVVAIKMLKFDFDKEGFPLEALREIALLSSLQHPNIVRMHAVACGAEETPSRWHLVMEPAGHELTTLVKGARRRPMTEAQVKHLMLQLLRALAALHSVWVMHRDLKTPNVLVDDKGVLRLCDFGLARRVCCGLEIEAMSDESYATDMHANADLSKRKFFTEFNPATASVYNKRKALAAKHSSSPFLHRSKTNESYATHTPNVISGHYRPPEVLLGCRDYGRSIDIWSAGCIFGELLSRKILFAGKDEPDQLRMIFQLLGEPSDKEWPLYSPGKPRRQFHP